MSKNNKSDKFLKLVGKHQDNYSCALVPVATLLMPKNCPEVPEDITEELIGDPTIRTWA